MKAVKWATKFSSNLSVMLVFRKSVIYIPDNVCFAVLMKVVSFFCIKNWFDDFVTYLTDFIFI